MEEGQPPIVAACQNLLYDAGQDLGVADPRSFLIGALIGLGTGITLQTLESATATELLEALVQRGADLTPFHESDQRMYLYNLAQRIVRDAR